MGDDILVVLFVFLGFAIELFVAHMRPRVLTRFAFWRLDLVCEVRPLVVRHIPGFSVICIEPSLVWIARSRLSLRRGGACVVLLRAKNSGSNVVAHQYEIGTLTILVTGCVLSLVIDGSTSFVAGIVALVLVLVYGALGCIHTLVTIRREFTDGRSGRG